MDLIRTMFKTRTSMSPDKVTSPNNSRKRTLELSPTRATTNGSERPSKSFKREDESRFSFEDVKTMLDSLLSQDKKKLESSVKVGVKSLDFNVPGHSVESCRLLLDKLVDRTRRIRTTEEVLQDIKDNLNKRLYTDVIQRFGLNREPPKRPATAYFLFHKERYSQLRDQMQEEYENSLDSDQNNTDRKPPQAAAVAVRISREWNEMDAKERAHYQQMHDDLVKKYERDIKRMGLKRLIKPKRPKSGKVMYVSAKLAEVDKLPKNKSKLASLKQKFSDEFDNADPEVKEHWLSLAREELAQYKKDIEDFCQSNPHLDRNELIKVRRKKVKIMPPAPPRNPCRMYIDKKLPENLEGQELKDTESKLREKFNKLSPKKTLKYIKKAYKEREQYEEAIQAFVLEHPDIPIPKVKPNISKSQWNLYQTHIEMKPMQPAQTAYLHFCSKNLVATPGGYQKPTKRLQSASAAWTASTQSEKAEVYKEHIESIKQYIKEMEAWLADKDPDRIERLIREDPKCHPDVWRKKLARAEKALAKRQFD